MLRILWKRGKIAPDCSRGAISPLIYNILLPMSDFYVKTRIRFSLQDKRLFEITKVEITKVDCLCGWSGGAKVLGKLPVPGRPTDLNYSRARAYCACSRCGWGLFGHFFSHLSVLFSFTLSLGDGPI